MKTIYKIFRTTLEEKPNLYSFVIFIALLLITVVTTYRVHGLIITEERQNAFFAGNALRNQIELTLNHGLSATQTIALLIEHGSLPSDFERVAEKMLRTYPVLDAIELAPSGVISHVYPYEQNKKAIGFNILGDSIQQAEAAEAIKTQKLIFAGPLNLVQGGVGVVGRLPVFRLDHGEKKFWGFSIVVIKIDRLLTLAKSDELQSKGYHFQLRRFVSSHSAIDTFFNKHRSLVDPMVLNVQVPNGYWQLFVVPVSGWNTMKTTLPFAFIGSILSCIIGLFIWYVGKQPEKLSKLVKERTEELLFSEEKLRHIFTTMEEGLALNELVYNTKGEIIDYRILEINPAFEHMTKMGRNNFVGKLATDVYKMPSEYINSFWNEHINDTNTIKSDIFNEELKSWKHVSTSKPVDGKFVTIFFDITELKNAELALRESENRYRNIVENLQQAYYESNHKSVFTYCNPGLIILSGYSEQELLSSSSFRLVANEHRSMVIDSYKKWMDEKQTEMSLEFMVQTKSGNKYWVEQTTHFDFNDKGRFIKATNFVKNITERVIAENKIKALNADLEDRVAQRTAQLTEAVAELEAFSYSVSHDLRAPLRSIDGYTSILHERYHDTFDEEGKRLLTNVHNSIDKMDQLIKGLLTLSRVGRGELRYAEHSMEQIVRSTFEECLPEELRGNTTFTLHPMPAVAVDLTLLHQMWTNLISNAIKYSAKRERPEIEIGAEKKDGNVVFYIKDNGAGFDPKYSHKLFGIFQRLHVDGEFKGLGIGLSIVKRIVQRHGGTVWAEGTKNAGATFYFSIPIKTQE